MFCVISDGICGNSGDDGGDDGCSGDDGGDDGCSGDDGGDDGDSSGGRSEQRHYLQQVDLLQKSLLVLLQPRY
ncbi:MAG TPA: hypothetical protein VFI73_14555 [Candidatus Nitrosopolaris sp.]|nr:hypothetical protein [Candidatus Nitrosopolaris sp.]